ncbi:hypothetical protein PISMIDRAFT_12746 [Pisolithus microcarpus 441]|uniref:Zn(2)-C6 fungal-type domain-containing protein n=1 Tax=Pisolithus microcarpus 441 TaxID=765257 RepID=A0A0C9YVK4_9AGAM|nr:hypothetical protein PISMIDRAFT_12746 [Pisolithus microcarpus 441]
MDADRNLPHLPRNPSRSHPQLMPSPDPQPRTAPPLPSQYQQPSLPPIRQLHPYLPPSGMQPHLPPRGHPVYAYPPSASYPGPPPTEPHLGPSTSSRSLAHPRSEPLESEAEGEAESQGPVKKKRRRQALSCNECKRRKIKCDRFGLRIVITRGVVSYHTAERNPVALAQPFVSNLHQHVFRDKYVTRQEYDALKEQSRAEYDQLKRRMDGLEAMVSRFLPTSPAGAVGVPLYSMPQDVPGPSAENIASYQAGPSSQVLYPPGGPPSVSYHAEATPQPHYYPTTSPHIVPEGAPHPSASATHSVSGSGGPGHIRRPSDAKSPLQSKQSPLSLASITSPYSPESQSKNWRAQMLKLLGEPTEQRPTTSTSSDVAMEGLSAPPTGLHMLGSSSRGRHRDSPGAHSGVTSSRETGEDRDRRQGPPPDR